ncbi:hypothetical protein DPX16_12181 [Anabarilius grahami]|uniref:Uncharacterized protein n=1 Tax=Anabarilius grahami TaxID=495550 RepID=A0A3N0YQT0_ANAGA|nr:hypothetical protein DPX16_12181 [Anabarilius grahami]
MRITVAQYPPSQSPWAPHYSSASQTCCDCVRGWFRFSNNMATSALRAPCVVQLDGHVQYPTWLVASGWIAGPSHGGPSISVGAPAEDQMSTATLERGLLGSGNEDEAEHPTVVMCAHAESDSELTTMLTFLALPRILSLARKPFLVPNMESQKGHNLH